MAKNKAKNKMFWTFRAATEDKPAELLLYGEISSYSWWGDEVTPKQFKQDLDALGDVDEINVYINSGGGDVFAGQAIHSMLKRHKAKINVYVDGLAASIASVIAMAGDTIRMPRNAMMMVHNPMSITWGDANKMRKMADTLDQIGEAIITTYQDKTGMEKDQIIELMDAETWMTAEEAVEYGFADEIEEAKEIAASVKGSLLVMNGQEFDLTKFQNPPQAFSPGLANGKKPAPKNAGRTLSSANEQRISQARDLLDEVLEQLEEDGDSQNKNNNPVSQRQPPLFSIRAKQGGNAMNDQCACSSCNHSDNCQAAGAKCCICGNCDLADKCSKPGANGCKCCDCTMAQTNCCQPGAESCMCDSCPNMDCMKGHMETEAQARTSGSMKDKGLVSQFQAKIQENKNRLRR